MARACAKCGTTMTFQRSWAWGFDTHTCPACGHTVRESNMPKPETFHTMSDPTAPVCLKCGQTMTLRGPGDHPSYPNGYWWCSCGAVVSRVPGTEIEQYTGSFGQVFGPIVMAMVGAAAIGFVMWFGLLGLLVLIGIGLIWAWMARERMDR